MLLEVAPQFPVTGCTIRIRRSFPDTTRSHLSFPWVHDQDMSRLGLPPLSTFRFYSFSVLDGPCTLSFSSRFCHWWQVLVRCDVVYSFGTFDDRSGFNSCRRPKFISLFCFVTRSEADKLEFLSNRCELSFVWPHIVFLACPSSVFYLAHFSKKCRPIVLPHTAAVQFHFFRPKGIVFCANLVRLRMMPRFSSCWMVWVPRLTSSWECLTLCFSGDDPVSP